MYQLASADIEDMYRYIKDETGLENVDGMTMTGAAETMLVLEYVKDGWRRLVVRTYKD